MVFQSRSIPGVSRKLTNTRPWLTSTWTSLRRKSSEPSARSCRAIRLMLWTSCALTLTRATSDMSDMRLFPKENVVGIFRGFSEGGLEFHADIVLPYQNQFQSIPMHGQFLIVQLAHENEAVLGRITSMFSEGRLASSTGEDYGIRVMREDREVPDDLRDQYLKYRVNIRVLGVMRFTGREVLFAPSHRRLPHVGSRVAFLSHELLREISGHNDSGADLGFFALGEFIYARGDERLDVKPWMQPIEPVVVPKFDITQLVSRRTFVFARAGFGKSNITKLLFSTL